MDIKKILSFKERRKALINSKVYQDYLSNLGSKINENLNPADCLDVLFEDNLAVDKFIELNKYFYRDWYDNKRIRTGE